MASLHSTRQTVELYEENWQAMLAGGFLRFADQPLIEFCRKHTSLVTVAAWDRVAQLVLLRDISAHRIEREVVFVRGEITNLGRESDDEGRPLLEDPALTREPTADGLLQALLVRGIDTAAVFGAVEALVLKLEVDAVLFEDSSSLPSEDSGPERDASNGR
jgi:hypothetical protein